MLMRYLRRLLSARLSPLMLVLILFGLGLAVADAAMPQVGNTIETAARGIEPLSSIATRLPLPSGMNTPIPRPTATPVPTATPTLTPAQRPRPFPLSWPTEGWISTEFGVPGPYWKGGYHQGIDIAVDYGDPVVAAASGVVVSAALDTDHGYGNLVVIDHNGSVRTMYAHLQKMNVKAGEEVTRGQLIGEAGATGYAIGPHLHFEVHIEGNLVDPLLYLPDRKD